MARVRPQPTASTADESVTADGILGDLKAAIDAISGHGITATIVGNGIHLKRSSAFNVSTPEVQLMSVVTQEINDVSRLPKACRNGYILKVVNSASDADDYFLKFNANIVELTERLIARLKHYVDKKLSNTNNITENKKRLRIRVRR